MRGHIKKRGDSYSIVLSLGKDPITGKRVRQWITVNGTDKDAEKRLTELLHQYDTGTYMKPDKLKVSEYLGNWLKEYAKPNLSPRGYERYEIIARVHLIPALGNIELAKLKPTHIQALYNQKLQSGSKPRTVKYLHTVLHVALNTALKWGLVMRNVADAVDPPRDHRTEMQTWNESELNQFLETSKNSPYYALFYTVLFTGMRRSEILALRWQDVDLIYGQISVNRSLHQVKDGSYVFTQPKTAKSRRTIALSPSAALVLKEHYENQQMDKAFLGTTLIESDLVFSTPEGKPYRPNTVTRSWQIIAARAGVKVIRFHDARHTHASLMLKKGIHPKIVQERLGHSNISMTLDTYSHVAPGLQEAAAKSFDEMLGQQQPTNITV
ncbi:tyrosine-type recombinase/integrase [Chloroflexota bacterium]